MRRLAYRMVICPICAQKVRRYSDGKYSKHYANNTKCVPDFVYDPKNTLESVEQTMVINWARAHINEYPCLEWLYSNLNGIPLPGSRMRKGRIINSMKKQGMVKGVFDLFLPYPRAQYHGFYLEMKKLNGTESPEQIRFRKFVASQGFFASFYYGHKSAIEALKWYLSL